MNIELIETHLNCQHPFGDGIHMIVPQDPDLINVILAQMKVMDQVLQEHKALVSLAGSNKAAIKCGVYVGKPPAGMSECYAVVHMVAKPGEKEFAPRVVFLFIEDGYEEFGKKVAEQLAVVLKEKFNKA